MSDEMNTPNGGEMFPPPNVPPPENDGAAEEAARAEKEKSRKKMRKCFNSCGWSVFTLIICWLTASFFVGTVISVFEYAGVLAYDFYDRYYMLFNELTLGIAILFAWLVLRSVPKAEFQKGKFSFGKLMSLFPIAIAMGYAGNIVSNIFITTWNLFTGNEVTNEVSELIMGSDIWISFVFVGIVGPILEELFFRKLLIDRLRPYGEVASVVISASFFALFHMNFSQLLYAFGVGLILGYLYYRSGNFTLTASLHVLFNLVMGVIPMVFYGPILEFYDVIANVTDESEMLSVFAEYIIPFALYGIYALALFALVITGIVFFCSNIKKLKLRKSEYALEKEDYRTALVKSAGMIAAVAVLLLLTVMSLFTV